VSGGLLPASAEVHRARALLPLSLPAILLGIIYACNRRLVAALDLRHLPAARLHCYAAHRPSRTSSHASNAIDVTNGQPLMKPSHDAREGLHRGNKRYHTSANVERGLDRP
jgi:hypothetical protein